MSDQELRDELMTLLVAGHETTATALAWALERLVRHPEMLERLAAGDERVPRRGRPRDAAPPAGRCPLVLRKLTEPMELDGRLLPAGVAVSPNIHLVHHRARRLPRPLRVPPRAVPRAPPGTYTWIPFGGGIRRCLGASFALTEMKTVLREVVRTRRARARRAPRPSASRRRAITWTPSRGARVVATAV